jgi:1,4-alpha-glucan branching enzyme
MITKRHLPEGDLLVTFMIPDEHGAVSVVGDFNGWDPHQHPLVELEGRRHVTVRFAPETLVTFRYLSEEGSFFDDPTADFFESNGYGQTHSVLDLGMEEYAPFTATEIGVATESSRHSPAA